MGGLGGKGPEGEIDHHSKRLTFKVSREALGPPVCMEFLLHGNGRGCWLAAALPCPVLYDFLNALELEATSPLSPFFLRE